MESGNPGFAEIFFVAGCGAGDVSLPGYYAWQLCEALTQQVFQIVLEIDYKRTQNLSS